MTTIASSTIERSGATRAAVPGPRAGSDTDPFSARLAEALRGLRPAFDPDPACRDRARTRIAAFVAAGRS